jgi:tetratricopeptide (TPR) repeat protein
MREPELWARDFALALIHHAAGRRAEADEALRELIRRNASDAAYQIAEVYAVHGATDAAFEWLERAYVQKDAGIPWTKIDPFLRSLHGDPRWNVFLRKLRFAE